MRRIFTTLLIALFLLETLPLNPSGVAAQSGTLSAPEPDSGSVVCQPMIVSLLFARPGCMKFHLIAVCR